MGIGDEIMVTGEVARLVSQSRTIRRVAVLNPRRYGLRWHDIWDGNPRIAKPGESFQGTIFNAPSERPYIAGKSDNKWTWKRYGPTKGEIYLREEDKAYGAGLSNAVIIQPVIKASASPNKNWLVRYWRQLVSEHRGVRWVQVGDDATQALPGAEFLHTPNFRAACGALAGARAAVLQEGGLHHAAAALGVRAVVIFGGFISPSVTGYNTHRNLFFSSGGHPLGCGMRGLCDHCTQAMQSITPHDVMGQLEELLNEHS